MTNTPIKVVFFGTGGIALPTLKALASDEKFSVELVVTTPDKLSGRGMKLSSTPINALATELKLKVVTPEKVKETITQLTEIAPELLVLASYGKLIPESALEIPKYGALNIHPSLLPKYRGPSPIITPLLNGEKETGVTIMEMVKEMDAGPIVAQVELAIDQKETGSSLEKKLGEVGADLLQKAIPDYIEGKIKPYEQDHESATFTKLFTQDDRRIDLEDSAEINLRKIRAFADSPGAWTIKDGKRLKIFDAEIEYGKLIPTEIQWEGKKRQKSVISF